MWRSLCTACGNPGRVSLSHRCASEGGAAEASVYGRGLRVPARNAALVNGTAAHAFELDDWHAGSLAHLGACVIPPVLAMAEKHRLPGRDVLAAIVVGFEVMARAGMSVVPSVIIHGFHPTGTRGPMGAAAGVAALLRFTPAQATPRPSASPPPARAASWSSARIPQA